MSEKERWILRSVSFLRQHIVPMQGRQLPLPRLTPQHVTPGVAAPPAPQLAFAPPAPTVPAAVPGPSHGGNPPPPPPHSPAAARSPNKSSMKMKGHFDYTTIEYDTAKSKQTSKRRAVNTGRKIVRWHGRTRSRFA